MKWILCNQFILVEVLENFCKILIFLELTLNDAKLESRMGGRRANLAGFLELKSWYGINRNMSRNVAYNPAGPLNGPLSGP